MKKLPVIVLLFTLAACSSKNTDTGSNTNPNAITVSMNGIGDLKIGMKKESVEKLLKRKITLPHLAADSNAYNDTVSCNYKGVDCMVVFSKEMPEDTLNAIRVFEIRSSSPLLKTRSGISIGDDKIKIITAYDGYRINIMPDVDYSKTPPVKNKAKSTIWLFEDESDKIIEFYLDNNKVESMSVSIFEGD